MTWSFSRRELLGILTRAVVFLPALKIFLPGRVVAATITNLSKEGQMKLPQAKTKGQGCVELAIKQRRTVRFFDQASLTMEQFSQILWAAQGTTDDRGYKRAAPSGGALYPMDVYAVTGKNGIEGLESGIYHYEPEGHGISLVSGGDFREPLAKAALHQGWMAGAPVNLVITAEYRRITAKYGERGVRYAMIEAGHIGQNIFLQAEALGLGAGIVGAFHDAEVIQVMRTPLSHEPLLIMPVGYKS